MQNCLRIKTSAVAKGMVQSVILFAADGCTQFICNACLYRTFELFLRACECLKAQVCPSDVQSQNDLPITHKKALFHTVQYVMVNGFSDGSLDCGGARCQ